MNYFVANLYTVYKHFTYRFRQNDWFLSLSSFILERKMGLFGHDLLQKVNQKRRSNGKITRGIYATLSISNQLGNWHKKGEA